MGFATLYPFYDTEHIACGSLWPRSTQPCG